MYVSICCGVLELSMFGRPRRRIPIRGRTQRVVVFAVVLSFLSVIHAAGNHRKQDVFRRIDGDIEQVLHKILFLLLE